MSDFYRMKDRWELMMTPEEVVELVASLEVVLNEQRKAQTFNDQQLDVMTWLCKQMTGDPDE